MQPQGKSWRSAATHDAIFSSVRASIHGVAEHLATSKLYRDKDLDHVLQMYNPNVNYPGVVKSVMRRISPSQ